MKSISTILAFQKYWSTCPPLKSVLVFCFPAIFVFCLTKYPKLYEQTIQGMSDLSEWIKLNRKLFHTFLQTHLTY